MSSLMAQIHIDTSSVSENSLPATPIPLSRHTELTPSTQLDISIVSPSNANKPQRLSDLADAMEAARSSLNQVLTSWKDWVGKEESPASRTHASTDRGDNQDDDEDDQDEEDEE